MFRIRVRTNRTALCFCTSILLENVRLFRHLVSLSFSLFFFRLPHRSKRIRESCTHNSSFNCSLHKATTVNNLNHNDGKTAHTQSLLTQKASFFLFFLYLLENLIPHLLESVMSSLMVPHSSILPPTLPRPKTPQDLFVPNSKPPSGAPLFNVEIEGKFSSFQFRVQGDLLADLIVDLAVLTWPILASGCHFHCGRKNAYEKNYSYTCLPRNVEKTRRRRRRRPRGICRNYISHHVTLVTISISFYRRKLRCFVWKPPQEWAV